MQRSQGAKQPCTIAKQSAAFTLMELLVVVGILGILASLLTTAIISAKTRASNIQCTANLKQHGVALNQFVHDNLAYPLGINRNRTNMPDFGRTWHSALFPDQVQSSIGAEDRGVFGCPAARRPASFPKGLGFASFAYNQRGLSGHTNEPPLGIGGDQYEAGGNWVTKSPTHESEIANPSTMIAIGDGLRGWNGVVLDGHDWIGRDYTAYDLAGSTKRAQKRHRGKANMVFCDGHVEGVPLTTLFTDTSDAALSMWNKDGLPHRERLAP